MSELEVRRREKRRKRSRRTVFLCKGTLSDVCRPHGPYYVVDDVAPFGGLLVGNPPGEIALQTIDQSGGTATVEVGQ